MDINVNTQILTRFLNHPDVVNTLQQLQSIGCTVHKHEDKPQYPSHITLNITGINHKPVIGLSDPNQMINGQVVLWVEVDDEKFDSSDVSNSHATDLACIIANKLNTPLSIEILDFCYAATRLNKTLKHLLQGF